MQWTPREDELKEEERLLIEGKRDGRTSSVTFLDSTPEALWKLSLLEVTFEDQTSKQQCEVHKVEKLQQEAAELETHARDMRIQAQEQKSVVSQLDLEIAGISQQIHILEEEIHAEQAKLEGHLLADLETARLGLIGLL
ncbi:hypothetical protein LIER_04988 [Lithospermum erythrorhizon]|uniref:Uncharacterized protein n=1 Tax=Lithospermum erythrorhizon TaxID=34254 RepID=A0AAV3P3F0_LITER